MYEYPTFVQTVDYEPFTINAKDGSEFIVDPTVSLKIVDGKSPAVFKKYRKELKDIVNGTLYNYVKNAFRIQLNNFTTDYIVSNRDSIETAIEEYLAADLLKENFQLEQMTSGLKYPETIVKAVNLKNEKVSLNHQTNCLTSGSRLSGLKVEVVVMVVNHISLPGGLLLPIPLLTMLRREERKVSLSLLVMSLFIGV